jgi:hypothetical protein
MAKQIWNNLNNLFSLVLLDFALKNHTDIYTLNWGDSDKCHS